MIGVLAAHTNVLGHLLGGGVVCEDGVCTWVVQQHHQIKGCVSIFRPKVDISPLTQQVLDNVFITEKRRRREEKKRRIRLSKMTNNVCTYKDKEKLSDRKKTNVHSEVTLLCKDNIEPAGRDRK